MRCSDSRESGQAQWGFTAVEMVITLAAGSILLAAVLITQLQLSRHGSRITIQPPATTKSARHWT